MANLTQREKELLNAIRVFNKDQEEIAWLVTKLVDSFGREITADMTGYDQGQIMSLRSKYIHSETPEREKVSIPAQVATKIETVEPETPEEAEASRKKIPGPTAERIATELIVAINSELKPGDKIPSASALASKYKTSPVTITGVYQTLLLAGIIDPADKKNLRKGYIVK